MESNLLPQKPAVVFFDVYETLLDMSRIKQQINNTLDTRRGYLLWFELLTQYCLLDNCVGTFHDFSAIAKATLQMAGSTLGTQVPAEKMDDMLHLMKHLPLHDGVPESLSALKDAGYRLAALTNAPAHVVQERMERTGLISYFDGVMSGEEIKKFKPACEVYQWAAQKMAVPTDDCLLVTAHPWDVAGAHYAGMKTAFIQRPQQMAYPLAPPPDFIAPKLHLLVERLVVTAS